MKTYITKPWKHPNLLSTRKKTPILKFFLKQKKSKKPTLIFDDNLEIEKSINLPNLIRYGKFSGMKDFRVNRCKYSNKRHGIHHIKNGYSCSCKFDTFVHSPLNNTNDDSVISLFDPENDYRLDDITPNIKNSVHDDEHNKNFYMWVKTL